MTGLPDEYFPSILDRDVVDEYVSVTDDEAFAAGRITLEDLLRGGTPLDWDVATDARPDRLLALFPGARYENRFGTVAVPLDDGVHEVTTFRRDGTYSDHRRPDDVTFGDTLDEDLARRDFTVNAMAIPLGAVAAVQNTLKGIEPAVIFGQTQTLDLLKSSHAALFGAITSKPKDDADLELDPALKELAQRQQAVAGEDLDHRLDERRLLEYCRERIAHYKVPRYVCFVDAFPTTVTGKIQKYLLREDARRRLEASAASRQRP